MVHPPLATSGDRPALGGDSFLEAVLDAAAALIVVLDAEARIVRFNRACVALTGWSEEELLGVSLFDRLIPDTDRAGVLSAWRTLTAGDFPLTHENEWATRTSGRRRIRWSNTCLLDERGEVRYVVNIGEDVTELRAAEAAQAEAEWQLRQSLDAMLHPVTRYRVQPDGDEGWSVEITYLNHAAARHIGAPAEDLAGRNLGEVLPHYEQLGEFVGLLVEVVTTGEPEHRELLLPGRRGPHWLEFSCAPVGVDEVLVSYQDIHARKSAEDDLRLSAERLRRVADDASDVVIRVDHRGFVEFVSPSVSELLGHDATVLHGRASWSLIAEADRALVVATCQRALHSRDPQTEEFRLMTADGRHVWVEAHVRAVGPAERPAFQAILRDITVRRAIEAELLHRATHDHLTGC